MSWEDDVEKAIYQEYDNRTKNEVGLGIAHAAHLSGEMAGFERGANWARDRMRCGTCKFGNKWKEYCKQGIARSSDVADGLKVVKDFGCILWEGK